VVWYFGKFSACSNKIFTDIYPEYVSSSSSIASYPSKRDEPPYETPLEAPALPESIPEVPEEDDSSTDISVAEEAPDPQLGEQCMNS